MNFLNKMERKFGKYAIPNLSLYLIMGYILGYVLLFVSPAALDFLTLNPYLILHGQIWRTPLCQFRNSFFRGNMAWTTPLTIQAGSVPLDQSSAS